MLEITKIMGIQLLFVFCFPESGRSEFVSWSPPRGLCGFFPAYPTLLVFSSLVLIYKVCHVLEAGHILQDEYCFLAISFYSVENPFMATKSNS